MFARFMFAVVDFAARKGLVGANLASSADFCKGLVCAKRIVFVSLVSG
jgi:hypothetical protein